MAPPQEEDKPKFAFTWEGTQFTFNSLPQEYKCSPTKAHNALVELPSTDENPGSSTNLSIH